MRISGGRARGIILGVAKNNATLRPAADRMREALFSSLGPLVAGARFLDFFAGTGAYGLEALSRGAAGGDFVENNHRTTALLRINLAAVAKSCGLADPPCHIFEADAFRWRAPDEAGYDLVFCDPPYAMIARHWPDFFQLASRHLRPQPDSRFIMEMPGEMSAEAPGWDLLRRLGHGRGAPTLAIYRATQIPDAESNASSINI